MFAMPVPMASLKAPHPARPPTIDASPVLTADKKSMVNARPLVEAEGA